MPNINNEQLPLLPQTNANCFSFFPSKKTIAKGIMTTAGAISGGMYWVPSFQAAKSYNETVRYLAALGGTITNSGFNIESLFNLSELPNICKIPSRYLGAVLASLFCILPTCLMNIIDEEGKLIDIGSAIPQGLFAILNVFVNIVGAIELINSILCLCKNKTEFEKNQLMEKTERAIINFSYLNPEEQTEANFLKIINNNFKKLTITQKICSPKTILGIISIPLILAYTLISYFDTKDLVEKKWGEEVGILFGLAAAIGNTIPSIGFLIKGINSTCENIIPFYKKLTSLERSLIPSWTLAILASFSGFTTHKAMEDSLKRLNCPASLAALAEALKWTSNLTTAFIYNLPQINALVDRVFPKKNTVPEVCYHFKTSLQKHIQPMEATQFKEFIEDLSSAPEQINNFFKLTPTTIQNDSLIDIEPPRTMESNFSLS
ncbi:MAG: hypothetical protein V4471_06965 [Pseudomonadota bacterium]